MKDSEEEATLYLPIFPDDWSIRRKAATVHDLRTGARTIEEVALDEKLPVETVAEWLPRLDTLRSIRLRLQYRSQNTGKANDENVRS